MQLIVTIHLFTKIVQQGDEFTSCCST